MLKLKGECKIMRVIIDRFEGKYAVVETESGAQAELLRLLVPDAGEGDVVDIIINAEETEKRRKKIKSLKDMLFEY